MTDKLAVCPECESELRGSHVIRDGLGYNQHARVDVRDYVAKYWTCPFCGHYLKLKKHRRK